MLWLRFLFLYTVAQAAADDLVEDTEGPSYPSLESSCDPQPPLDADNPLDLAKWALQQAAARLKQQQQQQQQQNQPLRSGHSITEGVLYKERRKVFFGWEHPRDPQEYVNSPTGPRYGYPSWWSFDEWSLFRWLYDFQVSTFDQGKFGHERPKPIAFASNSWMLYEALRNQFLTQEERQCFPSGPSESSQRIQASQGWACWAPGLTQTVLQAWTQWRTEQSAQEELQQRKALLKALTLEERHRRHVDNDHIPFEKGCPICIAAQGRQRSHRRQAVTGVFGASFDIAGPFISGQGFDAVSSGRDSGCGYKYFLACAYSIPVSLNAKPSSSVKDFQKLQVSEDSQGCVCSPKGFR